MTNPTPNFSALNDLFTNTFSFGTEWLIPLALAIAVMAVITKDLDKWKILALPIFFLERAIGMPVHFVLITFAAIVFVMEALSTQIIGNLLGTTQKMVGEGTRYLSGNKVPGIKKAGSNLSKASKQEGGV